MSNTQPLIVGLSCRAPGARGLSSVWGVLSRGRCTVGQVDDRLFDPAIFFDAHRQRRGKAYTFAAGQLDELYHFDANFFGISPRAAAEMEPQQRLMLQSVWEAVEDSGLNIADLAGDRTGVFVGASLVEMLPKYYLDPARGGSNFVLGNTLCVIANRVSSVFNFGGPSYVLDTACSSGLYALHHATEAIASGVIDTAIVGGVHVVRTPGGFVGFSQAQMLSPTGLCHAFDASADGYVRSEACVTVILMHPKKAKAFDARIRGRVMATGMNADGAAQQLTDPSAARQEQLLTRVLEKSGWDPEEIDFYEAHGTGTQVGDLAEATGLGEAIGTLRRKPLSIGSVKTNFGHAEPAAGLVGLTKMLLAMEHRSLPRSLHFRTPNPAIDFEALNLRVADQPREFAQDKPILAGVSSFGFGGTNVAAFVESTGNQPRKIHPVVTPPAHRWLCISAKSETSLEQLRLLWADHLESTPPEQWPALAQAAARLCPLTYRHAAPLTDGVIQELRQPTRKPAVTGKVVLKNARTVFAFPGNGAQHAEMGRSAYAKDPAYRESFDAVAAAFANNGLENLSGYLRAGNFETLLQSPLVAQPMLFACQVAQARVLERAGIVPDLLVGHSLGEIAALHFAGAFDLENAARIVMRRSARFEALRGQGGMLAVAASEADVVRMLSGFDDTLGIAAVNSPVSVTVAGPVPMLERFAKATLNGKRVAMVRLGLDVAYHSSALDLLESGFREDLSDIVFDPLKIPVAGAAVGRMLRKTEVNADYLWQNMRDPVRFYDAIEALAKEGPCLFLEIAPKVVLTANIRDIARLSGLAINHFVPPEPDEEAERFAATNWAKGLSIDALNSEPKAEQLAIPLPSYPWDEQEYFSEMSYDGFDVWGEFSDHTLAGRRMDRDAATWIGEFTPTQPPWVADHVVGNATILPAAALFEIALSAGAALWPHAALELSEFDVLQQADLGKEGLRIRTNIDVSTSVLTISMRPRLSDSEWELLARASLCRSTSKITASWPLNLTWSEAAEEFYDGLSGAGLHYGPHFQRLEATALRGKNRIYCRLKNYVSPDEFCLNPVSLDGAFHGLATWHTGSASPLKDALEAGAVLVPNRVATLIWCGAQKPIRFACIDVTAQRPRSIGADVTLFDDSGGVIAQLRGIDFVVVPSPISMKLGSKLWQRRQPRWRAPDHPVKWPQGWTKPGKVLEVLGLTKTRPHQPSQDVLFALRRALRSTSDHAEILAETLLKAPNLANDARDLLIRQSGKSSFAIAQKSASHRAIWQVAERLVQKLRSSWPRQERLNIAVLGLVDPVVVSRWSEAREIDDVILSGFDEIQHDYLAVELRASLRPRLRSQIEPGLADLIVLIEGEAKDENLDKFAAPNAMVLRLDTEELKQGETGTGTWFAQSSELSVRVSLGRAGHAQPVPDAVIQKITNEAWPVPAFDKVTGPEGIDTLVHKHLQDDTVSASLARLLSQLKLFHASKARPRILIIWNEGGQNFSALAQSIGAVLRSIRNELPDWALSAIIVETAPPVALWNALFEEALREPVLHVCASDVRIERIAAAPNAQLRGKNAALCVPDVPRSALTWRAAPRPKPGVGEVEIEVAATGLNFRDVLWAQGRVPDRLFDTAGRPASMGMECAGLVSRVGSGVNLAVGQAVMAFAPDAFRRHLVLKAENAIESPEGISLTAAASIPVAFSTAWESFQFLARLKKGESVLIHGAAGGVGMAAVEVAQLLGARVFATAGTVDKRALVQAMGVEAVFDSRDTGFGASIIQATQGRGVDVVLNSLSGAAMERSVACLAPFGRFVELGKRDILDGTRMNLRPFLQNLSYFAFDLDQRIASDPQGVRATIRALNKQFSRGALKPLPITEYASTAINNAVNDMQSARHVGKIVIVPASPKPHRRKQKIRGAWIIIGGNGGIGLALASALRRAGAGEIHLVSRSGTLPLGRCPEGDWALKDPSVSFHACDASNPEALAELFRKLGSVHGVVHAAMTLRDRLLKDLDAVEASIVIGSKLGVAEALDLALRRENIRPAHVLFVSSVAAYLGNFGQIAYSAANAGLEGIAKQRRQDGLAASVLGLGPVRDRGILAQDSAKSRPIAKLEGIDFLTIGQALKAIFTALQVSSGQDRLYAPLDWNALVPMLPALSDRAFDWVVTDAARNQKTAQDLTSEIVSLDWPAALALAQTELNEALSTILKLPLDQFDSSQPLSRYGIDSLMAMELRLEVEQRFGLTLPAASLTATSSTLDMAVMLARKIREDAV